MVNSPCRRWAHQMRSRAPTTDTFAPIVNWFQIINIIFYFACTEATSAASFTSFQRKGLSHRCAFRSNWELFYMHIHFHLIIEWSISLFKPGCLHFITIQNDSVGRSIAGVYCMWHKCTVNIFIHIVTDSLILISLFLPRVCTSISIDVQFNWIWFCLALSLFFLITQE